MGTPNLILQPKCDVFPSVTAQITMNHIIFNIYSVAVSDTEPGIILRTYNGQITLQTICYLDTP